MPDGGLPERIRAVVGPPGESGLPAAFDPSDPRHVDAAAWRLVRKLYADDDGEAWQLLVELTLDHVAGFALDAVREHALLLDHELLASTFYTGFLLDRRARADEHHFLAAAAREIGAGAEAFLRDVACLELARNGDGDGLLVAGGSRADGDLLDQVYACDDPHELALMVCFHRLELPDRRLLRALDVEQRTLDDLAASLGVPASRLDDDVWGARHRLADLVEKALHGDVP